MLLGLEPWERRSTHAHQHNKAPIEKSVGALVRLAGASYSSSEASLVARFQKGHKVCLTCSWIALAYPYPKRLSWSKASMGRGGNSILMRNSIHRGNIHSIPSPKLTANERGFCGTVGVFNPTQRKNRKSHGHYATIARLPHP